MRYAYLFSFKGFPAIIRHYCAIPYELHLTHILHFPASKNYKKTEKFHNCFIHTTISRSSKLQLFLSVRVVGFSLHRFTACKSHFRLPPPSTCRTSARRSILGVLSVMNSSYNVFSPLVSFRSSTFVPRKFGLDDYVQSHNHLTHHIFVVYNLYKFWRQYRSISFPFFLVHQWIEVNNFKRTMKSFKFTNIASNKGLQRMWRSWICS